MQKELTEKEAEEFLEKEGFKIASRTFIKTREELEKVKIAFPWAMKISSKKIVHKAKVGGIAINISSLEQAKETFDKLSKIENFQEVNIQEMKPGRELIIGIKKTPEFGQVIMFGKGGGKVEEEKDIAFRVLPITKKEAESLIKDIKFYDTLKKDNINLKLILENILRISELTKKYPNIIELDINPLIVSSEELNVIDARIILED